MGDAVLLGAARRLVEFEVEVGFFAVPFFTADFFTADFFVPAFLVSDFFASDFFASDFLATVLFAADFRPGVEDLLRVAAVFDLLDLVPAATFVLFTICCLGVNFPVISTPTLAWTEPDFFAPRPLSQEFSRTHCAPSTCLAARLYYQRVGIKLGDQWGSTSVGLVGPGAGNRALINSNTATRTNSSNST